mgnify:CR=1 FL=1|jgi:uncharacterized protein YeaO (DUF488 family)
MLHTVQISKIKSLPAGTQVIDITIKSSEPPWNIFAPTWEMVNDFKAGKISENAYTKQYMELMRTRYPRNKSIFRQLIQKALQNNVALACYCEPGEICHRHILKDIFLTIDPRLEYVPEPVPPRIEQFVLF